MPTPNICKGLLLLCLAYTSLFPSVAQTAQPDAAQSDSASQLKVQSNLVLVRVVVRDAKGNPVRDLKKEDFKLFDQGKEQSIAQFDEEPGTQPSAIAVPNPASGQTAVTSTASAQGPRFIALYFDELNSSDGDLMQARDAAEHYLATSLQPNDRVSIFTAEKILTNFTDDPAQIQQALAQLHASSRGPAHEHPCPDISDYQASEILHTNDLESDAWRTAIAEAAACPVKIFAGVSDLDPRRPDPSVMQPIRMLAQRILDQAQNLTRANLAQFEQVVKFIAQAPGGRTIVLVSPGFLSESEQYALDRIIDRALRAQVVINSLDPKGLAVLMRESDASRNTIVLPDPKASEARHHLDASKEFVGADVLNEVAQGTGGEFFHNDNDLKAGFAALVGDPPHYILAFSPQKVKWDGKFHALKVSLASKEKGTTIQARRGYFAVQSDTVAPGTAPTANNGPATPVRQANSDSASTNLAAVGPGANPASETPTSANQPTASDAVPSPDSEAPAGPSAASTSDLSSSTHPSIKPVHLHRGINHLDLEQLKQFVESTQGNADSAVAKELQHIELTQRLDSPALARIAAQLPGNKSREMLVAQADFAAFLEPQEPPVPLPPKPSEDDQLRWLKLAAAYLTDTLHNLPNFFATRDMTRFVDSPAMQVMGNFYSYQPLHAVDHQLATVLYRDGKQVLDEDQKNSAMKSGPTGLVTAGEFGPILATVLTDSSNTGLTWSRWEQGIKGPLAIYRFAVPGNKSHYEVEYCCLNQIGLYKVVSAYHGEIAIDPTTGSVLRIAIQADLKNAYPLTRADLLVEYGPVEIGGKSYVCPIRSVAIMKAYTKAPDMTSELPQLASREMAGANNAREFPVQTMINDIVFRDYHVFRADSRIVPNAD